MSRSVHIALCLTMAACAADEEPGVEAVARVDYTSEGGGGGGGGTGCNTYPTPPSITITTPDCGQAWVQWTPPTSACPSTFAGYHVYRCTDSACASRTQIGGLHSSTTANDPGPLAQNRLYYYGVASVDIWNREGVPRIGAVTTPACAGAGTYVGGLGNSAVGEMKDVVVVGNYTYVLANTPGDGSYTVFKLDSSNATVWPRTVIGGGPSNPVYGVSLAANESTVMVTGSFMGSANFGNAPGDVIASDGGKDMFVQRLDAATGTPVVWHTWGSSNPAPGTQDDEGTGVELTADGNYALITANTGCTINFSGGHGALAFVSSDPTIDEAPDTQAAIQTPLPVGYVLKLDANTLNPNAPGGWSPLRVGYCNTGTTNVTIKDLAYHRDTGKIAIAGSFKGDIVMSGEPTLTTDGATTDMFAMVFPETGWSGSHWISQFGASQKNEEARAITFDRSDVTAVNVYVTGAIDGDCTSGLCTAFQFHPCQGGACSGGPNLASNANDTIFLAKLSATAINHLPSLGWAASFPNTVNPTTLAPSSANSIVADSGRVTISGDVGGPGIAFVSGQPLNTAGPTAFVAAFDDLGSSVAGSWARGGSGTGRSRHLALDGQSPKLVGTYTSTFGWDNRPYPGTNGGFVAKFSR